MEILCNLLIYSAMKVGNSPIDSYFLICVLAVHTQLMFPSLVQVWNILQAVNTDIGLTNIN